MYSKFLVSISDVLEQNIITLLSQKKLCSCLIKYIIKFCCVDDDVKVIKLYTCVVWGSFIKNRWGSKRWRLNLMNQEKLFRGVFSWFMREN